MTNDCKYSCTQLPCGGVKINVNFNVEIMITDGKSFFQNLPAPSGYYPFNDSINDFSGNGYDLSGSPSYDAGKFGQAIGGSALNYSGSQPFLSGPVNGDWSISFWAKFTATNSSAINVRNSSNGLIIQSSTLNNFATARLWDVAQSTSVTVTASNSMVVNEWHHIVYVNRNKVMSVYVNGVFFASTNTAGIGGSFDAGGNLFVQAGGSSFIDDLAIIPAALTDDQISHIYNSGVGRSYL